MKFNKHNLAFSFFWAIAILFLIQDFSWSKSPKDLLDDHFNISLVREDGKGKMVITCTNYPSADLVCESLETQVSFPNDLFTTKFEKGLQDLKFSMEAMSDSEFYKEISKESENPGETFCESFSFFDNLESRPTADQSTSFVSRLKDLCDNRPNSEELVRPWMSKLVSELESLPTKPNPDTCGIFTKQRHLKFQYLENGKWGYTLNDRWNPLCPFVKYYELTMGENNGTWTLTETLLSLNSKSKTCKGKELELLKPQSWSTKASSTIKLPCDQVDWKKLSVE